jgi:hypothetical protein
MARCQLLSDAQQPRRPHLFRGVGAVISRRSARRIGTVGVCFDDGVVAALDGSFGDGDVVGAEERVVATT